MGGVKRSSYLQLIMMMIVMCIRRILMILLVKIGESMEGATLIVFIGISPICRRRPHTTVIYISQIIGIWRNNETDIFLVSCVSLSSIKYPAPNILLCIFTLLSALFDLYSTLLKRLNISSCYWSSVYKILSNYIK